MTESTAGIAIKLIPVRPGYVVYEVTNIGPELLSAAEIVTTLRDVAGQMEAAGHPEEESYS